MREYAPIQAPILQSDLLDSNYQYREYSPSRSLKDFVACYWTVDVNASDMNKLHRVIPDGCVDIIFDLKSPSFSRGAFVVGLMTEYEVLNFSAKSSFFGIRFYSDTARQFICYPLSELIGNHVFLEDIWSNKALFLVEEMMSAQGISEIIKKVELMLLKFLILNESHTDSLLKSSMDYMYANQGMISIRMLAEKVNYSERNIRRTFQKELGIGPKEFSGVIRFQSLLRELYFDSHSRFTDIAVKYGYFDQPHLIKSFKRYYGLSPTQIFK
ncbi:helix-turn-helix transcriptional regulator [Bacillaceae bacterium CLA-AA-H227]|uniref:Helix-turn-helix transcriptional regulator n=1 Tax=Robertmurraya yapensis (ex Hitch et al 2024) TaxID=3133160 RepID=A0ACC6SCC7_9BACI